MTARRPSFHTLGTLLDRVTFRQLDHMTTPCWEWTGGKLKDGYGATRHGKRLMGAHRAMWLVVNGPIPAGRLVCHTCDNPPCVNFLHLWLGTHSDNSTDATVKGRNAEHLAQLHTSLMGVPLSSEHRRKVSEAKKGKPFTETHRANMKAAWVKRRVSIDTT